jgi:hypothetical protein
VRAWQGDNRRNWPGFIAPCLQHLSISFARALPDTTHFLHALDQMLEESGCQLRYLVRRTEGMGRGKKN